MIEILRFHGYPNGQDGAILSARSCSIKMARKLASFILSVIKDLDCVSFVSVNKYAKKNSGLDKSTKRKPRFMSYSKNLKLDRRHRN